MQKGKIKFKYFTYAIFLALGFIFAPNVWADAPAPVYISQVQITGGKDHTDQDFIELFNPGDSAVNLKGYRLVKRTATGKSDSLIKSFTKDAFLQPKSFFLWANSGYTSISPTPDATTSVDLANDSGIGLRFGDNDTGTLIDSLAWGQTNNGFSNFSATNPGAGLALFRKDLYSAVSDYYISPGSPHNSGANDLSAAFQQSQNPANPLLPPPSVSTKTLSPQANAATSTGNFTPPQPQVEAAATASASAGQVLSPSNSVLPTTANPKVPKSSSSLKYLLLSLGALIVLAVITYQFFIKAPRSRADKE